MRRGDHARWVIHPPNDPYGDGYVFRVATELHENGMTASTVSGIEGTAPGQTKTETLSGFVWHLADGWQGWDGARSWTSLDRELTIDARHDRRAHVSLDVTLRPPGRDFEHTAWSARATLVLEAGEEMTRFATDLADFLRT